MQKLALVDYSNLPKGKGPYGPYNAATDMKPCRGGFASVHQVVKKDKGLGGAQANEQAFYALKSIRIRDEAQCEMVQREVEILRKVKHANILNLVEAFYVSDPRIVFLATQPWAPLSLEVLLRNALGSKFEPWHVSESLWPWPLIISDCIKGVGYLHTGLSQPIKHKDLKPHNILLYVGPKVGAKPFFVRPIIADFGISKEWEKDCPTDNRGTAQFKAPEQLKLGDSMLESDIWALGCCFVLILSLLPRSSISLLEIWEIGIGPVKGSSRNQKRDPGFSNNLESVMEMLCRPLGHWDFTNLFREMIIKMLKPEPEHRPSARDLDIMFLGTLLWQRSYFQDLVNLGGGSLLAC
jgi:serine/threonine protein kinase